MAIDIQFANSRAQTDLEQPGYRLAPEFDTSRHQSWVVTTNHTAPIDPLDFGASLSKEHHHAAP